MMPKLFLVYLGGEAPGANIEVHDVRFVVGDTIEDCFDDLTAQWFGLPGGLHMDSYTEIKVVDGFSIKLSPDAPSGDNKLYFVNMGGYNPNQLGELHQDGLFVAKSSLEAKRKALKTLLTDAEESHKDNITEVDHCQSLDKINDCFIHLEPTSDVQVLKPDWYGYWRIDEH